MKVKGNLIPDRALDAALKAMQCSEGFQSALIQDVITSYLPYVERRLSLTMAMQGTDRLIQRERKAGNIMPLNLAERPQAWQWVGIK